jgi:hypothetical protein
MAGDFSFMPMKEANRYIFIAKKLKNNVNIGWTAKIMT